MFLGSSVGIAVRPWPLQLTDTLKSLVVQLHDTGQAAFDRTAAITNDVNSSL